MITQEELEELANEISDKQWQESRCDDERKGDI